MSELQPPAWWQPPPESPARSPAQGRGESFRPAYREARPVRWWTVLLGMGGSVVWFALVAGAARGGTLSIVAGLIAGAAVAAVAAAVLGWKGEAGLGVGIAMVTGLTLSALVFVAYVSALSG